MSIFKLPISETVEWLCLIVAILQLRQVTPKYWRSFIAYMSITILVEVSTYYISHYTKGNSTHWIYNSFLAVYGLFHIWIFAKIIPLAKINWITSALLILFLGFYAREWVSQGFNLFFFKTNTLFGIEITFLSLLYFYSLFRQENYVPILKEPAFWFVTGCLIFYATSSSVNAFFAEILKGNYQIRGIIITLLNVVMYSCWIKSFLCFRKNQISTQ